MTATLSPAPETVVLHVGGLQYASEKAVIDRLLGRRPGVLAVDANPVAQTATVTFDPARTSIAELRRWVEDCGKHCAGRRSPVTSAIRWPRPRRPMRAWRTTTPRCSAPTMPTATVTAATPGCRWRRWSATCATASWSRSVHHPDRRLVDGRDETARHRARDPRSASTMTSGSCCSVSPVVLYASSIFFTGAVAALRAKTLDMMVLVAVAIGTGWLYSVAATFFIEGEVFYEAAGHARRPSCCSDTGSRCAPAAAPTTPSAPCSTSPRRRPWCCATASPSRSPTAEVLGR